MLKLFCKDTELVEQKKRATTRLSDISSKKYDNDTKQKFPRPKKILIILCEMVDLFSTIKSISKLFSFGSSKTRAVYHHMFFENDV